MPATQPKHQRQGKCISATPSAAALRDLCDELGLKPSKNTKPECLSVINMYHIGVPDEQWDSIRPFSDEIHNADIASLQMECTTNGRDLPTDKHKAPMWTALLLDEMKKGAVGKAGEGEGPRQQQAQEQEETAGDDHSPNAAQNLPSVGHLNVLFTEGLDLRESAESAESAEITSSQDDRREQRDTRSHPDPSPRPLPNTPPIAPQPAAARHGNPKGDKQEPQRSGTTRQTSVEGRQEYLHFETKIKPALTSLYATLFRLPSGIDSDSLQALNNRAMDALVVYTEAETRFADAQATFDAAEKRFEAARDDFKKATQLRQEAWNKYLHAAKPFHDGIRHTCRTRETTL